MANDIESERRVIPSQGIPTTPPSSNAARDYASQPKSEAIRNPPGYPGGPYGGSKDPNRAD